MAQRTDNAAARRHVNASLVAGIVAVLLAAFVMVFAITATSSTSATAVAGDVAPTAIQEAAQADSGDDVHELVAAGAAIPAQDEAGEGETIADEVPPMAAYSASVAQANPLEGFTWILLAGIAGAAIFFLLSTRRMSKDISRMRSSIR